MSDNPFEDKGSSGGANPFAEPAAGKGGGGGEFHNPFEQPAPAAQVAVASGGVSGGSAYETAPAPASTFGAYDTGAYGGSAGAYGADQPGAPKAFNPTPVPPSNGEATVRVRELDDRERVLDDRERELARREAELVANGGLKKKNYPFPGCFVFVYHSIQDDIPEDKKPAVKMAHYAFVITVTALCWNFLAATAAMFMFQSVMGWLMAAIYLGAGVPLAWILWYRRIYSACKHDSALGFLWFFIVFLVHIGFCICACCAFPKSGRHAVEARLRVTVYSGHAARKTLTTFLLQNHRRLHGDVKHPVQFNRHRKLEESVGGERWRGGDVPGGADSFRFGHRRVHKRNPDGVRELQRQRAHAESGAGRGEAGRGAASGEQRVTNLRFRTRRRKRKVVRTKGGTRAF